MMGRFIRGQVIHLGTRRETSWIHRVKVGKSDLGKCPISSQRKKPGNGSLYQIHFSEGLSEVLTATTSILESKC